MAAPSVACRTPFVVERFYNVFFSVVGGEQELPMPVEKLRDSTQSSLTPTISPADLGRGHRSLDSYSIRQILLIIVIRNAKK